MNYLKRPIPRSLDQAIKASLSQVGIDADRNTLENIEATLKDYLAQKFCVLYLNPQSTEKVWRELFPPKKGAA